MNAAMGMVSMSQLLTADREDETLLRAKTIPNGMADYVLGKVVSVANKLIINLTILLIPNLFLINKFAIDTAHWFTFT